MAYKTELKTNFQSYGKVSQRSAEGAERPRGELKNKKASAVKHKPAGSYHSGWHN